MATQTPTDRTTPLRLGSLFSGYGGLDLAVEEAFDACTVWFSEINQPVARVFSHHWRSEERRVGKERRSRRSAYD